MEGREEGAGGGVGAGSPTLFEKKMKLRNKNILLADLTEASGFMICLFRPYIRWYKASKRLSSQNLYCTQS